MAERWAGAEAVYHCHIPFIPLFPLFLFSQKSPSCLSHSLPLSGLFLMYPFGNRAEGAEYGDWHSEQCISINRAEGITMLALTLSRLP